MTQRDLNPTTDTTQQRSVRRPEAQIRLLFEKFQAFVDEYRPKISLGGVFIATAQPKPVGATIACEFKLADGFCLCQALGEVLWVRPQATAPDRPAGMGIRFQAIDDDGRKLILKILEEQLKTGGEPFEVERIPADAVLSGPSPELDSTDEMTATDVRTFEPPAPREDPASTHSRPVVAAPTPMDTARRPSETGLETPASVQPIASLEPVESIGFDAVEPLDSSSPAPAGPAALAAGASDFNAPWGSELPEIPDDFIKGADEADAPKSAPEDVGAESPASGLASPGEPSVLELSPPDSAPSLDVTSEAPDEISFSAPSPVAPDFGGDVLPDFDQLEAAAPPVELSDSPAAPALESLEEVPPETFDLGASLDTQEQEEVAGPIDEPLNSDEVLTTGPSPSGLDDTLARQLPDDGLESALDDPPGGAPGGSHAMVEPVLSFEPSSSPAPAAFDSPAIPAADPPLGFDAPLSAEPVAATPDLGATPIPEGLGEEPSTPFGFRDVDEPLVPESLTTPPTIDAGAPEWNSGTPVSAQDSSISPAADGDMDLGNSAVPDFGIAEPGVQDAMTPPMDPWIDSDADEEWEEADDETRVQSFVGDLRMTLAESKGRISAVVGLLAVVAAGLVFQEEILGLVGLGSPARPTPAEDVSAGALSDEEIRDPAPSADPDSLEETADPGGEPAASDEFAMAQRAVPPEATSDVPASPLPAPREQRPSSLAENPTPPRAPPTASGGTTAPATRVREILFQQTPRGTEVSVVLDGRLAAGDYEHNPLSYDGMKEQVAILGIREPYREARLEVATLELERIRTGLHGNRLNLVFDLSSERMTLSEIEAQADRLKIVVGRRP